MYISMSNFDLELRRKQVSDYYKSLNNLRQRTGIPQVSESDLEDIELTDELLYPNLASENTPLVSSAVGETAVTASAGGSILSSIPVTGVTAVAGLGGAAIIGSVFSAINNNNQENKHKEPIITLPGHKYLGPGNTIDTGEEPIDNDDLLAFNHDHDYNKAKTVEEVRDADREHILNSIDDILKGDIHSIISGAGIGAKYGIESITGVKYPLTG